MNPLQVYHIRNLGVGPQMVIFTNSPGITWWSEKYITWCCSDLKSLGKQVTKITTHCWDLELFHTI